LKGLKISLVSLVLLLCISGYALGQNSPPIITNVWLDVDYYEYDWCDEYAIIKGRVEAYDPDGDYIYYTWYVNGVEVEWSDTLWYRVWYEGWYDVCVKVEDEYGHSTWWGPRSIRVDFDWWCGGCEISSRPGALGALALVGGMFLPILRRFNLRKRCF